MIKLTSCSLNVLKFGPIRVKLEGMVETGGLRAPGTVMPTGSQWISVVGPP